MTDFEISKEVLDACELAQHDGIVNALRDALHKAAVLQKKLGLLYITHEASGNVTVKFFQDGEHSTLGHVDRLTNRFLDKDSPSPPRPAVDEIDL